MKAEVEVGALGGGRFRVQVRDGAVETTHEVTIPEDLREEPALRGKDPAVVVRESFLFLLERERAASILRRFSLDDISRYFPEYPKELARRLG